MSNAYLTTLCGEMDLCIKNCKDLQFMLDELSDDLPNVEGLTKLNQKATMLFNARKAVFNTISFLNILNEEIKGDIDNG